MQLFSFIIWDANPLIFPNGLLGFDIGIRWYGLLFALGFLISQQILFYIYKTEGKPEKDVETLTVYMVIATIIGARLGHVLFYEPHKYFPNVGDIFKIWEGGLASHGAAVGILAGLWIYSKYNIKKFKLVKVRREGQNFLQVVDRIVILVALAGALIRFGNFMNSEIIGKPTNSEYGVIFAHNIAESLKTYGAPIEHVDFKPGEEKTITPKEGVPINIYLTFSKNPNLDDSQVVLFLEDNVKRVLTKFQFASQHINETEDTPLDYQYSISNNGSYIAKISTLGIPRHPAQLYESFSCIIIFALLLLIWKRYKSSLAPGRLLGLFLILIFGLRFFYEFLKENQVNWENSIPLNMGQWLSIPLVIAGIYLLIRSFKKTQNT